MSVLKMPPGTSKIVELVLPETKPRRGYRVVKDTVADYFESSYKDFEIKLKKEAGLFLHDIETMAKRLKGVVFDRAAFEPKVLKDKESTFRKFYEKGEISDPIRTTIYMQNAQDNYMSVIAEMDKLGYKVVLNGKTPDITVRHAVTAQPSGYEDVAIKFTKKNRKHEIFREVIILPGPNYSRAKEDEHKIYEIVRQYKLLTGKPPEFVEKHIDPIRAEINQLSKKIYANAKVVDEKGMGKSENVTFTKKNIVLIRQKLMELQEAFKAEFEKKNPTRNKEYIYKQMHASKDYSLIAKIEKEIRALMEQYAPVD